MGKDWFDYLVGAAQIVTGLGVWVAFLQVKATQKQLELTQAQLEEEQKNGKPEVLVTAKKNKHKKVIQILAINVKNIPVFVSDFYVELISKSGGKTTFRRSVLEAHFGFKCIDIGVLSIGYSFVVEIPAKFFYGPFKGEHFLISNVDWYNAERVDIGFKVPGISPDPRISLFLKQGEYTMETDEGKHWYKVLTLEHLHNGENEEIDSWTIDEKPLAKYDISKYSEDEYITFRKD